MLSLKSIKTKLLMLTMKRRTSKPLHKDLMVRLMILMVIKLARSKSREVTEVTLLLQMDSLSLKLN